MQKTLILPRRYYSDPQELLEQILAADLQDIAADFLQHGEKIPDYPLFDTLEDAKTYLSSISFTEQGSVIGNVYYYLQVDGKYLKQMPYVNNLIGFAITLQSSKAPDNSLSITHCLCNALELRDEQLQDEELQDEQLQDKKNTIRISGYRIDGKGNFTPIGSLTESQEEKPNNKTRHGRSESYQKLNERLDSAHIHEQGFKLPLPKSQTLNQQATSTATPDLVDQFMQACKDLFCGVREKDIKQAYEVYKILYPQVAARADSLPTELQCKLADYHKYNNNECLFWTEAAAKSGHLRAKLDLATYYYTKTKELQGCAKNPQRVYELCIDILNQHAQELQPRQKERVKRYKRKSAKILERQGKLQQEAPVSAIQQEIEPASPIQQETISTDSAAVTDSSRMLANDQLRNLIEFALDKLEQYKKSRCGFINNLFRYNPLTKVRLALADKVIRELRVMDIDIQTSEASVQSSRPLFNIIKQAVSQNKIYDQKYNKTSNWTTSSLYIALIDIEKQIVMTQLKANASTKGLMLR